VDEFIGAISGCFEGPPELGRKAAECLLERMLQKSFIELRRATWSQPLEASAVLSSGIMLPPNT
jgi:hypothetical protein